MNLHLSFFAEALRMVSDSIKAAATAQGNNVEIVIIPPDTINSSNNKARSVGSGMASNFVNKYLNTSQNETSIAQSKRASISVRRISFVDIVYICYFSF